MNSPNDMPGKGAGEDSVQENAKPEPQTHGNDALNNQSNDLTDTITCPNCKTPNSSNSESCVKCGEILYDICPKCNRRVRVDKALCPHCKIDVANYRVFINHITEGMAFLKNQRYSKALTAFKQAQEIIPKEELQILIDETLSKIKSVQELINAGLRYLDRHEYDNAKNSLAKALELEPDSEEAKTHYDKVTAIIESERIKENRAKSVSLVMNAESEISSGNHEQAEVFLKQALELDPESEKAKELYASLLELVATDEKDSHEAEFEALLNSANALMAQKQYDQAGEIIKKAMALEPGSEELNKLNDELMAAVTSQEEEKAKVAYNNLVKQADDLLSQNEYEQASLIIKQALAINPQGAEARKINDTINKALTNSEEIAHESAFEELINRTEELIESREYTEADSLIKQALGLEPDSDRAKELNDIIVKAISENDKAKIDSEFANLLSKAEKHIENEEYEKADSLLKKALEIDPQSQEAGALHNIMLGKIKDRDYDGFIAQWTELKEKGEYTDALALAKAAYYDTKDERIQEAIAETRKLLAETKEPKVEAVVVEEAKPAPIIEKDEPVRPAKRRSFGMIAVAAIAIIAVAALGYIYYQQHFQVSEEDSYRAALSSNNPQSYLDIYPNGKWSVEMLNRADSLAYVHAVMANNLEAYKDYLKNHPAGLFASQANDNVNTISDKNAWDEASRANTTHSYMAYLNSHPGGMFVDQAKDKIKAAERQIDLTRGLTEAEAFVAAQDKNTIEAYHEFLVSYPDGGYKERAMAKIELLTYDIARADHDPGVYLQAYPEGRWNGEMRLLYDSLGFVAASKVHTIEAYNDYLSSFPEGRYAIEANLNINDLEQEAGKQAMAESMQAAESEAPTEFTPIDIWPKFIHVEKPVYPDQARQVNAKGTVGVLALVNVDGTVNTAKIKKSSGNKYLDQAAIDAAYKNKFAPAQSQGKAVEAWIGYEVDFGK